MDDNQSFFDKLGDIKGFGGSKVKPHKYLLLLSIVTLVNKNNFPENKFTFQEIEPEFLFHFNHFFPDLPDYTKMLEYPFVYLQNEGFWFLKVKQGKENEYQTYKKLHLTKKRLIETVEYGYFSEDLYNLLKCIEKRKSLEEKLVTIISSIRFKPDINGHIATNSLFAHEQYAINIIGSRILESNIGKFLNNICIYEVQSKSYFEYDIILVTHSGLFVIELKHWSGNVRIEPYNWVVGETRFRPDPHRNNSFKCKILKGIYQHQFRTYPEIWVESVVVFTHPEVIVDGADSPRLAIEEVRRHNFTFASIEDCLTFIRKKELSKNSPNTITDQQIENIINYLQTLNVPRQSFTVTIPGYQTIEYLLQKQECTELIARPMDGRLRGLNRFRIFRPPLQSAPEEKERFIKRALNTLNAVSRIGDHPNIHKVWKVPSEEGEIIEGSDWSEVGTLRDLIIKERGCLSKERALEICLGLTAALDSAHQIDVIHRAVKPEHILMMNGIPKLTNFDLSYQMEEGEHVTVITDVSNLKDDGYLAPEVLEGKDIDERTDYYSLGVIAYELLTGGKPFASVRELKARGGRLTDQHIQKLTDLNIPSQVVQILEQMIVVDRSSRNCSIYEILKAFSNNSYQEIEFSHVLYNAKLSSGETFDVYEIQQLIGEGSEAQIYKAHTLHGKTVVIKLFNKETPFERIDQEAKILAAVNSSYIVRFERIGYWNKDRYFIVMDYIDGESLRSLITQKIRPNWELFKTVTQCLMEALKVFHGHRDENSNAQPFLHSDIKPENVLLRKDQRAAVLIDCGIAGEPRVGAFQGTYGYVPPDCIVGTEMEYAPDGDLFALGVTIWEWLFGEKPYTTVAIGEKPTIPSPFNGEFPSPIGDWLLKSVASTKCQRFQSIEEMEEAFRLASQLQGTNQHTRVEETHIPINHDENKENIEEVNSIDHNPFVDYLNTLTNASAGNENAIAEAQIKNEYFQRIFVDNPLTDFVFEELLEKRRSVILTGNAGDGKTTIAADIYRRISGAFQEMPPRIDLDEERIVIIKDMSELSQNERIEVLQEAILSKNKNFLIVSNTGILLESGSKIEVQGIESTSIRSYLLEKMASDKPKGVFNERFTLMNIGRTDSINTACMIFRRIISSVDWEICKKCNQECPIYINVQLIKENENTVIERVELLYRRLYEYGVRLTLRQMTGHIAYSLTSGMKCQEILDFPQVALEKILPHMLFMNRFFGDDGVLVQPESLQLDPICQIRTVRFGTDLEPAFERETWVKKESALPIKGQIASRVQRQLMNRLEGSVNTNDSGASERIQLRRLAYFLGTSEDAVEERFTQVFLRSPILRQYLKLCRSGKSSIPESYEYNYRMKILQVLQEYFTGVRLTDGIWDKMLYITLNRHNSGARTQMVIADFRVDDFKLRLIKKDGYSKDEPGVLYLVCKDKAKMELDLPFLDYVVHRQQGELAEELSAYYSDRLERFKVQLLKLYVDEGYYREQNLRLLRIFADRKFHVLNLNFNDKGSLEVLG